MTTPIPVAYPPTNWLPVDDSLLADTESLSPSGKNIWLYKEQGDYVTEYVNWPGWHGDLEKLKLAGYTLWAPCVGPPDPPRKDGPTDQVTDQVTEQAIDEITTRVERLADERDQAVALLGDALAQMRKFPGGEGHALVRQEITAFLKERKKT